MNSNKINELYNGIKVLNDGARAIEFDLHIHSPASKDFKMQKDEDEKTNYLMLLDEVILQGIEIIAITDHNTFSGYNKLINYAKETRAIKEKYKSVLILCGIEITCYSNHLLAIFNNDFSEENQNQFLHEIGIERDSQGTEEAMADELGPSALLKKIDEYGGIAILAHADTEKGFLYPFFHNKGSEIPYKGSEIPFKGKSLSKIIKSPFLYGIQVSSEFGEKRIRDIIVNKDYNRHDRALPFLYFSDAHGFTSDGVYSGKSGKSIGSLTSKAKLSHKSFNALKMALADEEMRIIKNEIFEKSPIIVGCAIKSNIIRNANQEYALFKFSDQLNCVIGSRGTGKSTLLGIIQDVLEYDAKVKIFNDRYETAVVFIQKNDELYAVSNDSYGRSFRKVYVKSNGSNTFKVYVGDKSFLNLFLTRTYGQGELYDYHLHPSRILDIVDNFIMWKQYQEYGNNINTIIQTTEDIRTLFDNCIKMRKPLLTYMKDQDLYDIYLQKYYSVLDAKNNITRMREEFAEKINKILGDKVKLRITFELDNKICQFLLNDFTDMVAREAGRYYDYKVEIRGFINSIIKKSEVCAKFDFFALLITNQEDRIFREYCIKDNKKNREYLFTIKKVMTPTELMLFLDNGVSFEYNVNSGMDKATPVFRNSYQLSLGQNAVALLLVILTASRGLSDNRPLLMDQPEDDLDNSYIFNTLVKEFRRTKNKRQLIISTHNANIPVSADAENIIVLKYNGEYGYLYNNGSLDNPEISKSVLDILEGGELAMRSRNDKYKNIVKITK